MIYFFVEDIEKDLKKVIDKVLKKLVMFKEWLEEVIVNLLEKFDFSDEQIAGAANVPVKRVQKIRKKLQK